MIYDVLYQVYGLSCHERYLPRALPKPGKCSKKKESMLKLRGIKLRFVVLKLVLSYKWHSGFFREVVYIRKSFVVHTSIWK